MVLPRWSKATLRVANVELRRSWRRFAKPSSYRGLKLGFAILSLGIYTLGAAGAGFAIAVLVREGSIGLSDSRMLGLARSVVLGFAAMIAFFALQRTIKGKGVPDGGSLLLTSTSHRGIALGLLLAETIRILLVAAGPTIALASGLAAGFGRPVAFPVMAGTLIAVLGNAVAVGFVVGLAAKNVAARSRFVASHRLAMNLLGSVGILGGYLVLLADPSRVGRLTGALRDNPLGWPADLGLLLTPIAVRPDRALVAGVALLVLPVIAGIMVGVLARWLYYTDPMDGNGSPEPQRRFIPSSLSAPIRGVVARRLSRPTRSVVLKSIRRVRRAPYTAQYAILPVFFLFYEVQALAVSGEVPPRLPAMLAVAAAWATGAIFSLNPVGNEEPVLPVTLTTGVSGREFVYGLAIAGIVFGLPFGLLAVLAAGIAGAVPPASLGPVVVASAVLSLASPGLAAAVGARFPKRQATAIARGREIVLPSPWAFLGYSALVMVCAAPLVGTHLEIANEVATWLELGLGTLELIGVGATIGLAAVVGGFAYVDAARTMGRFRLD